MLLNGIADAVPALQRGVVAPRAWHGSPSRAAAESRADYLIFGEEERSSWKVLIVAAILTKDTGFAIDADKDLVDRIAAVVKLFLAWIAKAEARRRSGQQRNM